MSQLKLDHHGKLESTERPFRPNMGRLSNTHLRSRPTRDSNSGSISLALESLSSRTVICHPVLPNSIMEANAGFKHEISIGSSTRQSTEEELAWGVDTRITVPPRHSAFAEVS
ncbi:unnamed protein product [Schistosoma margrebowiei]|uniref:Uncharacterized protein n=1 Tax=Schistosoma margrebowiei TaxID=48269 RepID=A0A183LYV4_9TREM|nr:unnamed protein product [Schistosoma margrebowiei]